MGSEDGSGSSSGVWKKLGFSGVVAAVGAGVGLLLTMKPKRLRDAVAELPGSAHSVVKDVTRVVEDVTQRARSADQSDGVARPMPQEISDQFEARRRERRERRERRRQHATG
jgi:hypothetical protein